MSIDIKIINDVIVSLYDDYEHNHGVEYDNIQATDFRDDGTASGDTMNHSSATSSWTIAGYSGVDTLTGGSMNDVLFGGLGNDTKTGGGGDDQFYYTSLSDGTDTITDFGQSGDADTLLFNYNPTSNNTRSTIVSDGGSAGTVYNISSTNTLPNVWNFTNNISSYSASNIASTLTTFRITTDGSTAISNIEEFFLLVGDGTNTGVFVWKDTGNGAIASGELTHIANLNGVDNDSMTGTELAFQSITGV